MSEKKVSKPSKLVAVLFDRSYNYTPSQAKAWVKTHIGGRQKAPTSMHSEGGQVLAPGSYVKIRLGTEPKKPYTSFGYMEVSAQKAPGVYFQIAGHRKPKRKARELRDHLGPDGRYFVDYKLDNKILTEGPLPNLRDANRFAKDIEAQGGVAAVCETSPSGEIVYLD